VQVREGAGAGDTLGLELTHHGNQLLATLHRDPLVPGERWHVMLCDAVLVLCDAVSMLYDAAGEGLTSGT
jgi:hypothetical protein